MAGAAASSREIWLAPLRGVTIRAFRETFASQIREAGFSGAFAPFIPANPGLRFTPRLVADLADGANGLPLVPQAISRHPDALRELLKGFLSMGFRRADLNAGCPFPMIVRRGRGSGLLRTPDLLERLVEVGCETMGPGNFSVKTRLGVDSPRELLSIMPRLNRHPLAALTIHARTARQMYGGMPDFSAFAEAAAASANPVICNGDLPCPPNGVLWGGALMIGRSFIRSLGERPDANELLAKYVDASERELCGDSPVLGRVKELLSYWAELPCWRRTWSVAKLCRSVAELRSTIRPRDS